jgi:hypothetical protein
MTFHNSHGVFGSKEGFAMRARARCLWALLAAAAVVGLVHPAALTAQSNSGDTKPKFDSTRLVNSEGRFQTFHVTQTQPLRQALGAGALKDDTRVLVTETARGKLALLTDQMAFHHIAQGVAAGKEWMVTF